MNIHYLTGDATQPAGTSNMIIVHVCNDIGKWGRGFVMALSRRWPEPEQAYKAWHASNEGFHRGEVQFVEVSPTLHVANLIGQKGTRSRRNPRPVCYPSIRSGLVKVAERAVETGASVHMPRIGCGLAGGEWSEIEPLLREAFEPDRIPVYVYDLEKS